MKNSIDGEKIDTIVALANRIIDATSIGLRPYLSLIGPKNIWPKARPSMLVARPICTCDAVVWKTSAIEGNVGRYISVTKGPNAESIPRKMIKKI